MKSVYNEQRYLNDDFSALMYFEKGREAYKKNEENSLEKNKDIIKYYDIYLDYIADELLKHNFRSSLDYSIALGYLIRKGYLSEGLEFNSKVPDKEITGKLGINIVQGNGCCRNITGIHKDIFDRLNINIIPFYCYQGIDIFNNGLNEEANHIINLVEYDNNMYGIDIYNNNLLFHFKNPFIMRSISNYRDEKLRYKPYYELIVDGKTIDDIKDKIKLFDNYSKEKAISSIEYEIDIEFEIENYLFARQDRLNNFHEKTKSLRKNIISRINIK